MFIHERCQTEESRKELASELFHEALGYNTTEIDFFAKLGIKNIERSLRWLKIDPDPFWVSALRRSIKREVEWYKKAYGEFTRGSFESNDNGPVCFEDLT